ncbi:hypothetical protein ISS22_17370 [candidate division KSB1 bacterium]|nr:hypothetical protein [candidate division KSB1 bacterium]
MGTGGSCFLTNTGKILSMFPLSLLGIKEYWSDGLLAYWSDGLLELLIPNNPILQRSSTPFFQRSQEK